MRRERGLPLAEACWHALVLGVVQGLTEFLPISSTAHLKVVPVLLGWGDPGVALTAVIQLGSIAAVLAYFRDDLGRGAWDGRACRRGHWSDPSARLGVAILRHRADRAGGSGHQASGCRATSNPGCAA